MNDDITFVEKLTNSNDKKQHTTPTLAFLLSNFRLFIFKATQLYLRHPLKLFKPIKYDTLFYLRIVDKYHAGLKKSSRYSNNMFINNLITNNSLCVIYRSIKTNGLSTLYDKVLPPLLANSISGTVLFTTYLTLNKMNSDLLFVNGFVSGIVNTFVNTPLQNFYNNKIINNEPKILELHKNNKSLIKYVITNFNKEDFKSNINTINKKQVMRLLYLREGLSYATYFSVFEKLNDKNKNVWNTLTSGIFATVSLQIVNYPLTRVESIMTNFNVNSYKDFSKSLNELKLFEKRSVTRILYQGFLRNTISNLPSMTTTLILLYYLIYFNNY